jgi:hypothetical protein
VIGIQCGACTRRSRYKHQVRVIVYQRPGKCYVIAVNVSVNGTVYVPTVAVSGKFKIGVIRYEQCFTGVNCAIAIRVYPHQVRLPCPYKAGMY